MFTKILNWFRPTVSSITSKFETMAQDLERLVVHHSAQSDRHQKAANAHQAQAERAATVADNLNKLVGK